MFNAVKRLWQDDAGAELTEYSLVIGVVALGAIAVLTLFRNAIRDFFDKMIASLNAINP